MTTEREREIINGIIDLIEDRDSFDFCIAFPKDGYKIHIKLEEIEGNVDTLGRYDPYTDKFV